MLVLATIPTPAWADASVQVQHLCDQAAVPCSIQMTPRQREGAVGTVIVTGRARSSIAIQAFRLNVSGDQVTGITPFDGPFDVHTDNSGYGTVTIPFPPTDPREDAGWILVAPNDVSWEPAQIVGSVASYATRRPTILGDGYGPSKPIGQPLDLQVTNAITGTRFAVEYLADDGSWRSVSNPGSTTPVQASDGITHIAYTLPQGLVPRVYTFRLFNITDPSAVAQQWQVTPALTAPTQPRLAKPQIPSLGASVAGGNVATYHPTRLVNLTLAGLSGLALVALASWPALALRRRRTAIAGWSS